MLGNPQCTFARGVPIARWATLPSPQLSCFTCFSEVKLWVSWFGFWFGFHQSGGVIHSESTFVGQTFASMNLNPGDYLTTWGTGANADFIDVQIGPQASAVPEPSTFVMFGMSLVGVGFLRCRRQ